MPIISMLIVWSSVNGSRRPVASKFQRHENAVRILDVAGEWRAGLEAEFSVKSSGRLEVVHRSCFQAQPAVAAPLCLGDDLLKEHVADAFPQVGFGGAHRFDFAMPGIQFLQRAAAK